MGFAKTETLFSPIRYSTLEPPKLQSIFSRMRFRKRQEKPLRPCRD